MEVAVSAVRWVVGKALAPVTDGLLEAWAASAGLGPNIDALKMELLYAQGMLANAHGREIHNPALKEMLNKLRQLAYNADDVLDELEYFRIQDALDGTYHAADVHDGGCIHGLALNARHTGRAIASKLKICSGSREGSHGDPDHEHEDDARQGCLSGICSSGRSGISSTPKSPSTQSADKINGCKSKVTSTARWAAHNVGKRLPCCSFPCVHNNAHSDMLDGSKIREEKHVLQTPKLKFNRVEISIKMKDIVEKLKPVSAKVSTILDMELLGSAILKLEVLNSNTATTQKSAMDRPKTTPDIIEPKLYGRDNQKRSLIEGITNGQYFSNDLVVLPIVGPGGIGKTTFTQHVYDEVKKHFEVAIWICVSLSFDVSRLAQEAVKKIPKVDNEKENSSAQELIELRLKTKRFLLVLDDMWTCHEVEWKKLLAPFRRGGEKGNMVIVTTRIPEVAEMVRTVNSSIQMGRLNAEDFMHFFEECVFGKDQPWENYPDLLDVGKNIVSLLKGFPLAAKTVGRLLRKELTLDHWTRVLESKEWELQTSDNDIMPALKLSYDYLPFHLQQCFSYCSLFPEDYTFHSDELIHLWIGLDIIHSSGQNKRTEDIGRSYLTDLVNNGILEKNEKDGCTHYVIHDLLHNLAVTVSSYECITILSSNVRSVQIPTSVRHLSIIIDAKEVENRMNFDYFKTELQELDKRLNVENLRTLMLFGTHHGSFAKTFGDLFEKAGSLRTIYLSGATYIVEDVLHNFSKLVHLRYLRIKSYIIMEDKCQAPLPTPGHLTPLPRRRRRRDTSLHSRAVGTPPSNPCAVADAPGHLPSIPRAASAAAGASSMSIWPPAPSQPPTPPNPADRRRRLLIVLVAAPAAALFCRAGHCILQRCLSVVVVPPAGDPRAAPVCRRSKDLRAESGRLSTDQKKTLLWGNKKSNPSEETSNHLDLNLFSDREGQEKFNKLMGVKSSAPVQETKVENKDWSSAEAKKLEELDTNLEKHYIVGLPGEMAGLLVLIYRELCLQMLWYRKIQEPAMYNLQQLVYSCM